MNRFFYPESIGIVGVSDDTHNLGKDIVENLIKFGFSGKWHAVGHKPGRLFDQPIYPSISHIPDEIDLAIVLTRSDYVPETVESCGQKGIKRLVVSSAGFSEYSEEGAVLEKELLEICQTYGIRLIGPNCLAVLNMENGLCLPFAMQDPAYWKKGPVGVISQSGTVVINYSKHLSYGKVGVGKVASIGNKLDVDEVDLLEYFLNDPQTEIIFLYLENFSRPRDLLKMAASSKKPIILQKSNTSMLSRKIAESHTSAITGDDAITDFSLKQAGIIRVRDIYEMMNCVKVALLPPLKGNRLAAMSPGGGTAVMCADESHKNGFLLPPLPPSFLRWLEGKGRAGVISLTNPLDLGDIYDIDVYIPIIEKLLKAPEIDGIFLDIGYAPEWSDTFFYDKLFEYFIRIKGEAEKPVFLRANVATPEALPEINDAISVPYFESLPGAFAAVRKVMDARKITPSAPSAFTRPESFDQIETVISNALSRKTYFLDREGYSILEALSIPVPKHRYLSREKTDSIRDIGLPFPVAIKTTGGEICHKTELGAVHLNLQNSEEISNAITSMLSNADMQTADGFIIQEIINSGIEMLVGGKRDPQFGPVVVVGMGGVFVELISDSCPSPAPVDMDLAERMIKSLKGYPLLSGFRSSPPADVKSLCRIIKGVSDLMAGFPAIEAIDLNPVKVLERGSGSVVVDCKIFLSSDQ